MQRAMYDAGMQLWAMTDGELRAELARVEAESLRHDEIMEELEDRTIRRRAPRRRYGWHSATDIHTEGS